MISRFGVPAINATTARLGLLTRDTRGLGHRVGVVEALQEASTWASETRGHLWTTNLFSYAARPALLARGRCVVAADLGDAARLA